MDSIGLRIGVDGASVGPDWIQSIADRAILFVLDIVAAWLGYSINGAGSLAIQLPGTLVIRMPHGTDDVDAP